MKVLAESSILYILVILGILYVTGVSILFLIKAWRRAKELGISQKDLGNIVKASVSFSLVPSISIVVGFFSLATMIGIPWSWFRLSVIGSVGYEIMAADMALKATGSELATAGAVDFVTIMYVMSISILGGLFAAIFFAKKIQTGAMQLKEKDAKWGSLGNSTFMLTIIVVFLVPMILKGGVYLLTLITSGLVAALLSVVMTKFKWHWLSNFILAISLIVAMASSVLWTNLL